MLAIDCGDHRDHRREQQERAVALIRFHHHVLALAYARVGSRMVHPAADYECGVKSRGREH